MTLSDILYHLPQLLRDMWCDTHVACVTLNFVT